MIYTVIFNRFLNFHTVSAKQAYFIFEFTFRKKGQYVVNMITTNSQPKKNQKCSINPFWMGWTPLVLVFNLE